MEGYKTLTVTYQMILFEKEIEEAGYSHTKELSRIKWTDKVDYAELKTNQHGEYVLN